MMHGIEAVPCLHVHRVETPGADLCLVWAHGWGQDHRVFLPIIEAAAGMGTHLAIDFPGFGKSGAPADSWGTADYADHAAQWLQSLPHTRFVWIGHSFGCRVGVQLAARHPGLLSGLVLIAPAGLRPHRTLTRKVSMEARKFAFRIAKSAARHTNLAVAWRDSFGSRDYRAAGPLRPIFVRVVSEDLGLIAASISCTTLIICGADDRETPPEMSQRLAAIIPGSELVILSNYDHYTILSHGMHQVANLVGKMVADLA